MSEAKPVAVYRLPVGNRLLGFVVYCLVGPVVALMAGAIAFGIFAGLGSLLLGPKHPVAYVVGALLSLAVWVGLTITMIRLYRRHECGEIRIWPDRLEQSSGDNLKSYPYQELAEIEYAALAQEKNQSLVVRTQEGRRLELSYLWPLAEIVGHLRHLAVPFLVRRSKEALDRGETLAFREAFGKALRASLVAALFAGFGLFLTSVPLSSRKTGQPIPWLLVLEWGILPAAGAVFAAGRAALLLSNGMILSRSGVRSIRSPFGGETPWTDIRRFVSGERGLSLEGDALERPYRLSLDAANYLVLLSLVPELAKVEVLHQK